MIEHLPMAEKLKSPVLACIGGLIMGIMLGWGALHAIHQERFIGLETSKQNLEQRLSEAETTNTMKDAEIARLREQLGLVSPANSKKEIETLIRQLDMEIAQKKRELARVRSVQSEPIFWAKGHPTSSQKLDRQKSDQESRIEKELDSLAVQRDGARRRLIELTAQ
jgi:hypothetical protein